MTDNFVAVAEAARRLGVGPKTLRRRIRAGELPTWGDPLDQRRILIRVDDIDRFGAPRPRTTHREEAPAVA